jgi:hypothetical protein
MSHDCHRSNPGVAEVLADSPLVCIRCARATFDLIKCFRATDAPAACPPRAQTHVAPKNLSWPNHARCQDLFVPNDSEQATWMTWASDGKY